MRFNDGLRSDKYDNFAWSAFKGKSKGYIRLYWANSSWFLHAWRLGWLEWAQQTLAGLNQCQTVDHHHFPDKTLSSRARLVLRFPPWLWSLAGVIWPAAANRSLKTLRSVWSSSWWAWLFYELCSLGWCLGWRFTALTACSTAPRHESAPQIDQINPLQLNAVHCCCLGLSASRARWPSPLNQILSRTEPTSQNKYRFQVFSWSS